MTPRQPTPYRVLDSPRVACANRTPLVAGVMHELPPGALLEVPPTTPPLRVGLPA